MRSKAISIEKCGPTNSTTRHKLKSPGTKFLSSIIAMTCPLTPAAKDLTSLSQGILTNPASKPSTVSFTSTQEALDRADLHYLSHWQHLRSSGIPSSPQSTRLKYETDDGLRFKSKPYSLNMAPNPGTLSRNKANFVQPYLFKG